MGSRADLLGDVVAVVAVETLVFPAVIVPFSYAAAK